MRLVVFDVDGTLTLGDGLGTRCFFSAFEETFGCSAVDSRLESYAESTDAGIAFEAAVRALGRAPREHELEAFQHAYLARLEREIGARDSAYRAVPGAADVMTRLAAEEGWGVALATGNWRRAAALKLECARIAAPPVAACAEQGRRRAVILSAAMELAARHHGRRMFDRVVYVGDQPWDLQAAREAGAAFVGIGAGERAARLGAHGARVVEGYEDGGGFLEALEEAAEAAVTPAARRGPAPGAAAAPGRSASCRD